MKSRIEIDFESLYRAKPLGGLSADELIGSSRRYPLPIYRGMIAEQLRNRGYSLPAIGKLFGRSHATILHELRLLKNLDTPCYRTIREEYEDFKRCCENIKCETNMKTIEERADEYVDAPCEKICSECSMLEASCRFYNDRLSFIAGAKSEHNLLTEWNSPDDIPDTNRLVLIKINNDPEYAVGYYNGNRDIWNCPSFYEINSGFVGWREIHE